MSQSPRLQAIEYLAHSISPKRSFLPFINERSGVGQLLGKKKKNYKKIKPKNSLNEQLKNMLNMDQISTKVENITRKKIGVQQVQEITLDEVNIKQEVKTLEYLLQRNGLDENQQQRVNQILTRYEKKNSFQYEFNEPQQNLNKTEFIGYPGKNKILFRNSGDDKKYLDQSLDMIKIKKKEESKEVKTYEKKQKKKRSKFETPQIQKQMKEKKNNELMYFDLLKTIKKEVKLEQSKNPQQLLYPNAHLSITPMEKRFAEDNYQELLNKAQNFRDGRKHLSQIQEELDQLIYFRKYKGVRDKDDELWYL